MRVFLADLGHNHLTVSSDIYPLSVANCATHARTLDPITPNVVGFSSHAWYHNLPIRFARYGKGRIPGVVPLIRIVSENGGAVRSPTYEGEQVFPTVSIFNAFRHTEHSASVPNPSVP